MEQQDYRLIAMVDVMIVVKIAMVDAKMVVEVALVSQIVIATAKQKVCLIAV